jgi:hypothetical protein
MTVNLSYKIDDLDLFSKVNAPKYCIIVSAFARTLLANY